jgi:hypothetical protein
MAHGTAPLHIFGEIRQVKMFDYCLSKDEGQNKNLTRLLFCLKLSAGRYSGHNQQNNVTQVSFQNWSKVS